MTNPDFLTWVDKAYSWNSGGGNWIDVLVLNTGICLSVTEESVVIWESEKHFAEHEVEQDGPRRNYVAVGLAPPFWVHQPKPTANNTWRIR